MTTNRQVKLTHFSARQLVLHYDEFMVAHAGHHGWSRQISTSVLKQYVAAGRLLHLRRGFYASIPPMKVERVHMRLGVASWP